jgi:hypothetical protein
MTVLNSKEMTDECILVAEHANDAETVEWDMN